MALRINLYHEIQRTRKQAQYDPLKISFVFLCLVALGLAGWYFAKLSETNDVRDQHAAHKADYAKLEPASAQAKLDEAEATKQIQLAEAFTKRIEDRFYWAPVLETVSQVIPRNVQVTKVIGDISAVGASEPTRRVGLHIDGITAGEQPRKVAEDLRLALVENLGKKFKGVTASFRSLDDSVERMKFDNADYATALFSITISFQTVGPEPAPNQPKTAQR